MKKLIIAPHPDDAEYGLGAMMYNNSDDIILLVFCMCQVHMEGQGTVTEKERKKEHREALHELGLREENVIYLHYNDNLLLEYGYPGMVCKVNKRIDLWKPDEIYFPLKSFNQDHRAVHEVCITAFRPTKSINANLWMYEYPGTTHADRPTTGVRYIKADSFGVKAKENALYKFKSQIPSNQNNLFHPDMTMTFMELAGAEADVEWAERVYLYRMVT